MPTPTTRAPWGRLLILEDDGATSRRRLLAAVGGGLDERVTVRLHEVRDGVGQVVAEDVYRAGTMLKRGAKAEFALSLLAHVRRRQDAVVVAGAAYGSNGEFLTGLRQRGFNFVTEVRASELAAQPTQHRRIAARPIEGLLKRASWRTIELRSPSTGNVIRFAAAHLPGAAPHVAADGCVFVAQTGEIPGLHRGTIVGFSSEQRDLEDLVAAVVWARWIRPTFRQRLREGSAHDSNGTTKSARLTVRANIALAEKQDSRLATVKGPSPALKGVLGGRRRLLNVVELFAGAGGMGLGFLLAGKERRACRLVFSGEVNPIYTATLRGNHAFYGTQSALRARVPPDVEPIDLRGAASRALVAERARRAGGVDILIGGPPCQGFSNANRNSWSRGNPNNRLVDVFLAYVETLLPPVFVMENVQGILWTAKAGRSQGGPSVVDHLARRFTRAGYAVFPRLLDAAWYGVPQYRSRFFLVGLHRGLGYHEDDFGDWGPFPRPTHGPAAARPYVTVRDAIVDLPRLRNGEGASEIAYAEPSDGRKNDFLGFVRDGAGVGVVHDHVTSRHADYVIDRYRRIPPGGNWEDIADTMSNYADVERTHSNIYRRLTWDSASVTIGHYRKSMLVHPSQHRGLSLREAARLQSFPDWFRFSGTPDGRDGGLVHKQQQLANAVCPLVTKALAEFLMRL